MNKRIICLALAAITVLSMVFGAVAMVLGG